MVPDINTTDLVPAVVGGSAELNCIAQGGGDMNQFQWFASDGSLVSTNDRVSISMVDNGVETVSTITIDPVESADQGMYTCVVTTGIVTINSSILLVGKLHQKQSKPLRINPLPNTF